MFFLPDVSIPEKILLDSKYAKKQYENIVNSTSVTNENAKEIFAMISEEDYGNREHINDLIEKISYKWSKEENSNKKYIEDILNEIYKK